MMSEPNTASPGWFMSRLEKHPLPMMAAMGATFGVVVAILGVSFMYFTAR